ncbi:MAG: TOMM precursor leader peptide-binding protein [Blastocatellia bacterium]
MDQTGKIKLKNSVFVVPGTERQLQIRAGDRTLKITGAQVELLAKVVEELRTERDVRQIVTNLPEYPEQNITSLLERLESLNLLEDPAASAPAGFTAQEAAYYTSQLQFFSHRAKNRFASQAALKNASVTVLGLGRIGSLVASNLLSSGVGHLHLVDSREVEEHDIGPVYGQKEIGRRRTEALSGQLNALNPFVRLTTATPGGDSREEIGRAIQGGDFVVVCEDDLAVRIYETVNEICLQKRIKWLAVNLSRQQGLIGPMVIPGETPCYRCYKLREKSNAAHIAEYEVFDDYLRNNPNHKVRQGSLRPFDSLIGSMAALEVVYALTHLAEPRSLSSLVVFDLSSLELEAHPILRLPRCPSCSPTRGRPKRKIYDI